MTSLRSFLFRDDFITSNKSETYFWHLNAEKKLSDLKIKTIFKPTTKPINPKNKCHVCCLLDAIGLLQIFLPNQNLERAY